MTYNTKYYARVKDIVTGDVYTYNLKKSDYTGSTTTEIEYYDINPATINYRGDARNIDKDHVNGSEMTLRIWVNNDNDYSDIIDSNYREWQLEVLKNDALYWKGFVLPENISMRFLKSAYLISLSASCGLAQLKDIDFSLHQAKGYATIISVIKYILDQTQILLNVDTQVNYKEHNLMLDEDILFDVVRISRRRFEKIVNGQRTSMNCYDAILNILKSWNASICQSGGKWVISNKREVESRLCSYSGSTVTATTVNDNYTREIVIDNSAMALFDSDEVSRIEPLRRYSLTFQNRNAGDNVFWNGSFDSGTDTWNNGDDEYAFEFWQVTTSDGNYYLRILHSVPESNPNEEKYFYSDPFGLETFDPAKDKFQISVDIDLRNVVWESGYEHYNPILEIQLIYPDQSARTYQDTLFEGLRTYTATFDLNQTGDYQVYFVIRPIDVTLYDSYELRIDNIEGVPIFGSDITFDKNYQATNSNNYATSVDEDTIIFSDSALQSDIGNFRIENNLTSVWNNYQGDEQLYHPHLLLQNKLADRDSFKNYLRISIRDENYNINFYNVLNIKNKRYAIATYSRDIQTGVVHLELVEMLNITT